MQNKGLLTFTIILFTCYANIATQEITGLYINNEKSPFESIEFIDDHICRITTNGIQISGVYQRKDDHILLSDQNGSLIFTIIDINTLIGEGYCKGKYIRQVNFSKYTLRDLQGTWKGYWFEEKVNLTILQNQYQIKYSDSIEKGEVSIKDDYLVFKENRSESEYYFSILYESFLFIDRYTDFENESFYMGRFDGVLSKE